MLIKNLKPPQIGLDYLRQLLFSLGSLVAWMELAERPGAQFGWEQQAPVICIAKKK
jgi:hypothetical protein